MKFWIQAASERNPLVPPICTKHVLFQIILLAEQCIYWTNWTCQNHFLKYTQLYRLQLFRLWFHVSYCYIICSNSLIHDLTFSDLLFHQALHSEFCSTVIIKSFSQHCFLTSYTNACAAAPCAYNTLLGILHQILCTYKAAMQNFQNMWLIGT